MPTRTAAINDDHHIYQQIFHAVTDAIYIIDLQGRFLDVNDTACRMLEYSRDELMSRTLSGINAPEYARLIPERRAQLLREGSIVFETVHVTKSGRFVPVEVNARHIEFMGIPAILSITRDISVRSRLQADLVRSRDYYLKLFDDFPALIWRSDTTAQCDYFNKTWLAYTGKTLDQELNNGWVEGVHPDDREQCMATYLEAFDKQSPFEMEYRLLHRSGAYRWIVDHGSPFYGLDGQFAGYVGSCYDINGQKQAEQELRDERSLLEEHVAERSSELLQANARLTQQIAERQLVENALRDSRDRLRELTDHLTLTKETERKAMARTVHDELGTYLTALRFDLSWYKRHFPPPDNIVEERFTRMEQNILDAITTVGRITSELRPVILDTLGIEPAIESLVTDFEKRTGIICELTIDSRCHAFDTTTAINLYRILQECLTNILRHSGATRVTVSLQFDCDHIEFAVSDNGWGIAEPALSSSHSFGLVGMRERARICGGQLSIVGSPDLGTTVLLQLPFTTGRDTDD